MFFLIFQKSCFEIYRSHFNQQSKLSCQKLSCLCTRFQDFSPIRTNETLLFITLNIVSEHKLGSGISNIWNYVLKRCTTHWWRALLKPTHLFRSAVYWNERARLRLVNEASHEPVVNDLAQRCDVTLKANVSKTKYVVVDFTITLRHVQLSTWQRKFSFDVNTEPRWQMTDQSLNQSCYLSCSVKVSSSLQHMESRRFFKIGTTLVSKSYAYSTCNKPASFLSSWNTGR